MTSNRREARCPLAGALVALLLVASPLTSAAQSLPPPTTQPSAADLESARELFKEGRELRQSGDLKHALERFRAAHAYGQTPVTALELGRTHIQLGELVEGREVLLSVARMKVQSDETDKSAAARAEAADLAEDTKKRIPTLTVKITGIAADATPQVTVDGAAVPVVAMTGIRKVNPGKHVVVARLGGREETRTVELPETKTLELAIDLGGAAATAAPPPMGAVTEQGSSSKQISPITWVGLGVGGVGIGIGTVFGVIALGKASKVSDVCSGVHCPPTAKEDVDSGRSSATISTIGFTVAGAGLIAAALGYFLWSKPSTTGRGVAPVVTVGGVGLDGRF